METQTFQLCSLPPSGSFIFKDSYDIIYEITWTTGPSGLDMNLVTKQPRVWGQPEEGFIRNHIEFRRGLISSQRQVIAQSGSDIVIVAEGGDQQIDIYQATFPCGPLPIDPFCYHFDCGVTDEVEFVVNCGPRWTDPDNPDDLIVSWGDVDISGEVIALTSQLFQFIDVWANDEDITSTCSTD